MASRRSRRDRTPPLRAVKEARPAGARVPAPPDRARMARRRRRLAGRRRVLAAFLAGLGLLGTLLWARCRRVPTIPALAPYAHFVEPPVLASDALHDVTVVIDPGHGGEDPGAERAGISEATYSYRMAATLATVCQTAGAQVRFTVNSDALAPVVENVPEPELALPRDAAPQVAPKRVLRRGRESVEDLYARAKLAAQVLKMRPTKHIVFIALHFDVGDTDKKAAAGAGSTGAAATTVVEPERIFGGWTLYDSRAGGAPPALATNLSRWLAATGLSGDRPLAPCPRELGVLNPKYNPLRERALVEMATISDPGDRAAIQAPEWRWRTARVLAAAIADTVR